MTEPETQGKGRGSLPRLFPNVIEMNGFDTSDGYRVEPLDNRDEDEPDYTIDPILSSSNTDFGGEDPAKIEEPTGTPAERATFDPRNEV